MKPKRRMFLLDMDGTITPARESMDDEMLNCLMGLARKGDIGILSGSDIDYIMEQCGRKFILAGMASRVTLLPCNGTKVYKYSRDADCYQKIYSTSMREEIGRRPFELLISGICRSQSRLINRTDFEFPVSGHFISERGSTLNWSIIGRSSSGEDRKIFSEQKDRDTIRELGISMLQDEIFEDTFLDTLEMTLGGQTSIDIYPKGWDKTYALRHYPDHDVWFVGDKCEGNGNDRAIYELLKKIDRAFKTSGPEETMQIVDNIVETTCSMDDREHVLDIKTMPPPIKHSANQKKTVVVSPGDTIVFVDVFELSGPESEWFQEGEPIRSKPKKKTWWQKLVEFVWSKS